MEYGQIMTLEELRQKYGDDCRVLVIAPERLGFVPSQEHTIAKRSEKVDIDVEMREVDVDKETNEVTVTSDVKMRNDGDQKEEKQRMQDYYRGRVVILEEDEGIIVYSGEGTETDPVVVECC